MFVVMRVDMSFQLITNLFDDFLSHVIDLLDGDVVCCEDDDYDDDCAWENDLRRCPVIGLNGVEDVDDIDPNIVKITENTWIGTTEVHDYGDDKGCWKEMSIYLVFLSERESERALQLIHSQ